MSKTVLFNARVFAGAADLTGASNKVELSSEIAEKDATTFQPEGSGGWRVLLGGLASTTINASGLWEAGDPGMVDDALWEALNGRAPLPWTVCPVSASVGALAYFSSGLTTSYKMGDAVGEIAPWESEASGSGLLLRGTVMHAPGAARTANGSGDSAELGALLLGQRLFASLHVLSVSGDTPEIEVRIESSADDTWASPTTRATFGTMSAPGADLVSVTGPVTDTWWRIAWDITGDDPSFLFLSAVGIA